MGKNSFTKGFSQKEIDLRILNDTVLFKKGVLLGYYNI